MNDLGQVAALAQAAGEQIVWRQRHEQAEVGDLRQLPDGRRYRQSRPLR